jgi:uncharacterized protein YbjT (DUF2867 family)
MRILVVGASQGTGALAVRAALDKGYEATAFARTPEKLVLQHERLRKVVGDFQKAESLEAAMPGHDAVIITALAGLKPFKENPNWFSRGTGYVIEAMKKAGTRRLVILSAMGVAESRPLLNPIARILLADFILRPAFEDHARQEAQVRASGLDWVIARPGMLTNRPARHKYKKKITLDPVPSSIARADVADFLVDACVSPSWVGHAVQLGG